MHVRHGRCKTRMWNYHVQVWWERESFIVCTEWHFSFTRIHLFQKTSERTANGSCRTEIARPKGTVVSIFGMQKQWAKCAKLGSLSNPDDESNKNSTNLHIWQWNTVFLHALHVHFSFFDICRRSRSFYDVKWPVLQLCGRREHIMTNVQFCLLISQALVPG